MEIEPALRPHLAQLVAEHVRPALLAEVIADQQVVPNPQELIKLDLNDPALAQALVETYARSGRLEQLMHALVQRDPKNSKLEQGVNHFRLESLARTPLTNPEDWNKQAAIVKRANTLRSPDLRDFLRNIEGWICVVGVELKDGGGRKVSKGTGFLVGPDLVLTARHVLKGHIVDGQANRQETGQRCVFFDHLDGNPIGDPLDEALPSNVRRVDFHPSDWLVTFSDELPKDGLFDPSGANEIDEAKKRLDFVLIRLAVPVGKQSRYAGGGTRRGWLDLWPVDDRELLPAVARRLATDDRIIIPQHPYGQPQQIDFGRYVRVDASESRIRYDTETEEGTSGAPCFNHQFNLVGVHNARYAGPGSPLNQAIRFDHIHRCLEHAVFDAPRAASRLWSVSGDNEKPKVILGREPFLQWIAQAASDEPGGLVQRAFVVEGLRPKSGKTFSSSILRAARRGMVEPLVVFNKAENPLPNSAADMLLVIANQLRIGGAALERLPPRPSDRLPQDGDGDKLALWSSRELPKWFAEALGATRVHSIDAVEEAKKVVDLLRSRGFEPSRSDLELAASAAPRVEQRFLWSKVWIVLDDVSEESVTSEVRELIARLLGVGAEEGTIASELRRLRWVFLGWRPGFLDGLLEPERLDQCQVGRDEVEQCVSALVDSLDLGSGAEVSVQNAMKLVNFTTESSKACAEPSTRLEALQEIVGYLKTHFEKPGEQR
ncbi:MAG: trypsin-like serine peptidase [Blastomonas fulva]